MLYNLAIDADSLIYKALERSPNDEEAYMEFCGMIAKMKTEVFKKYGYNRGDMCYPMIILSPQKTFRNEICETYKHNRPPSPPRVVAMKKRIYQRLHHMVTAEANVEADEIVVYLANHKGFIPCAIDKDVKNACEKDVLDYNKNKWEYGKTKDRIEEWYIIQTIMGDGSDGFAGVSGMGIGKAKKFVDKRPTFDEWAGLFDSIDEAITTMRLVRMDQWTPEDGITLWQPEDWYEDWGQQEAGEYDLPDWLRK